MFEAGRTDGKGGSEPWADSGRISPSVGSASYSKRCASRSEQIVKHGAGEEQETVTKLRLWERKLLDLSLRNNLINMKLEKNAIRYEHDEIAILKDELDQGKVFVLEQKELKGIYRAVRTNLKESGVNTLFLTFGTLHWNERQGGREYAAPILLVTVYIVPVKKLMKRCRQLSC